MGMERSFCLLAAAVVVLLAHTGVAEARALQSSGYHGKPGSSGQSTPLWMETVRKTRRLAQAPSAPPSPTNGDACQDLNTTLSAAGSATSEPSFFWLFMSGLGINTTAPLPSQRDNSSQQITVFVPVDEEWPIFFEAFGIYPDLEYGLTDGALALIEAVIAYSILPRAYNESDLAMSDGRRLRTQLGDALTVDASDPSNIQLVPSSADNPPASIVQTITTCEGSVVHVIDRILIPAFVAEDITPVSEALAFAPAPEED